MTTTQRHPGTRRLHRCPECRRPTTQPELCLDCIEALAKEGTDR